MFIDHQIFLLKKDYEQALLIFERLYDIRTIHLKIMEEKLLPLYESALNEFPKGGKPLYFIREKKLILKDLNKQMRFLGQFVLHPEKVELNLVKLFEEYAWLKDLLDHHDAREKAFLFPTLEKELPDEQKKNLLEMVAMDYPDLNLRFDL
ncbi:MAG: hypothetical protein D8M58_01715 [Calditrichaeota bacterium]|nr:MAG: hypothetical protein DWQ03_05365 [Calditrichota bacterium]MBL1204085.1 hypothetical protein [Calditrichota bacterium]